MKIAIPLAGFLLVFLLYIYLNSEVRVITVRAPLSELIQPTHKTIPSIKPSEDTFDGKRKKLPEIGIIGVKKCGTGAVIEVLRMHPEVVALPYDQRDIRFWHEEEEMEKGLEYYKVI